MIEYKNKEVTKVVEVAHKYICNKCSKDMTLDKTCDWFKGGKITADFEYGSGFDGVLEGFELCDDCYEELINWLQIKPTNLLE